MLAEIVDVINTCMSMIRVIRGITIKKMALTEEYYTQISRESKSSLTRIEIFDCPALLWPDKLVTFESNPILLYFELRNLPS